MPSTHSSIDAHGSRRLASKPRQVKSLDADKGLHHEALVEHKGAHVKEDEQRGGMFAEARKSDMDLAELGAEMETRKKALMKVSS